MVTFLMTFSTPNLVFNITIFLKANISKPFGKSYYRTVIGNHT